MLSSIWPLTIGLGIAALYAGFAFALGALARAAVQPRPAAWLRALAPGYALLLFAPATLFVLSTPACPGALRAVAVSAGLLAAAAAWRRPAWVPPALWRPQSAQRYLAGAMALTAFGQLGLALSEPALAPTLVGAAAGLAGAASLCTSPRRA